MRAAGGGGTAYRDARGYVDRYPTSVVVGAVALFTLAVADA